MRVDLHIGDDDPFITLTLSRRNLRALLSKLDDLPEGIFPSACTITTQNFYIAGEPVTSDLLCAHVCAQEDGPHYADREAPGQMHGHTEVYVEKPDAESEPGSNP